MKKQKVSL